MARPLPSGRVTFAFTDVVNSTRTFREYGDVYVAAVRALHAVIAAETAQQGGAVVSTEGDGAMLAFPSATGAVAALSSMMDRFESFDGSGLQLRIRAGAHTGMAVPIGDEYVAMAVYVAARVSATANAGQIVVAQSVIDDLPVPAGGAVPAEELGDFSLKDIAEPVTLWRLAGDRTPPRATPARRTNVAAAHTSFVGREAELAELRLMLETPGCVTLVGPGGRGKTRLVSEYALANADRVPAGVWLAELASLQPGAAREDVLGVVASALGGPPGAGFEALSADLRRRGEAVLLLDNCEHVVEVAADLAADLIEACPDLRLLATSREALAVDGERVLRLGPLSGSDGGLGPAERLFLNRAETAGVRVPEHQWADVTELCARLDGLPLALELAAARMSSMSVGTLVEALAAGEVELRRRGGADRQRSLESLVWWSLRLLDEEEQTALFVLSAFPGRFSPETARTVLGKVPGVRVHAAPELARHSLLDLDGDDYRMLSTIRSVARRELEARPDAMDATMRALLAWGNALAQQDEHLMALTPDDVMVLELVVDWALSNGVPGSGQIMRRVTYWSLVETTTPGARSIAERILAMPPPQTADEIRLQVAALRLSTGLGGAGGTGEWAGRAEALVVAARDGADEETYWTAMSVAAALLDRAGRHPEALAMHLALIEHAESLGLPRLLCKARTDLGVYHHLQGQLVEAEAAYRAALEVAVPEDPNLLILEANLGEVLLDAGHVDQAVDRLKGALQGVVGRISLRGYILALLVDAECRRGSLDAARALAAQAESDLQLAVKQDPSLADVLDRMRTALSRADA